jgi:hypothetical protein
LPSVFAPKPLVEFLLEAFSFCKSAKEFAAKAVNFSSSFS